MQGEPRFHEHSFTLAVTAKEHAQGMSCPCGHLVKPDPKVAEGEAVRESAGVTLVGIATMADLNKLRTPFQTEAYFPACPVRAIKERASKERGA